MDLKCSAVTVQHSIGYKRTIYRRDVRVTSFRFSHSRQPIFLLKRNLSCRNKRETRRPRHRAKEEISILGTYAAWIQPMFLDEGYFYRDIWLRSRNKGKPYLRFRCAILDKTCALSRPCGKCIFVASIFKGNPTPTEKKVTRSTYQKAKSLTRSYMEQLRK